MTQLNETELQAAAALSEAHENAKAHGWWDECIHSNGTLMVTISDAEIASKLCLIHSEVSEGLEELRHGRFKMWHQESGKPEGLVVELADAIIRAFDLCGALGLDLPAAIVAKHEYNKGRPYRHGGKAL